MLCFYRARFSIQSLFKTTPCPLKRQRENHTGVLASDSSHTYTVDRRSSSQKVVWDIQQHFKNCFFLLRNCQKHNWSYQDDFQPWSRCTPTANPYHCVIHVIVNGFCIVNELPLPEEISSELARPWVRRTFCNFNEQVGILQKLKKRWATTEKCCKSCVDLQPGADTFCWKVTGTMRAAFWCT